MTAQEHRSSQALSDLLDRLEDHTSSLPVETFDFEGEADRVADLYWGVSQVELLAALCRDLAVNPRNWEG